MLGVALGARTPARAQPRGRFGVIRPLVALLAVAAIVPQVVVLAAGIHLRNSAAADAANNGARAKSEALAAKAIEPWDASTWLQLALVDKDLGEYRAAGSAIRSAIRRAPDNYLIWEAAATIDTLRGDVPSVLRDLREVRRLNPNASILHNAS